MKYKHKIVAVLDQDVSGLAEKLEIKLNELAKDFRITQKDFIPSKNGSAYYYVIHCEKPCFDDEKTTITTVLSDKDV